ncbi:mTERF domain-containing protein 1, mitochondrial, partial [Eufriesea mexicana]
IDHSKILTRNVKSDENIETNSNITKVQSELIQSHDIKFSENDIYNLNDVSEPGPFDHCDEDLSHIGPNITPTYNFAKFANESNTIRQLVNLGVELYKLEANREVLEMFLSLDFDTDMKPYIQFLHDCGVHSENLGHFITRNPMIFKEDIDDLHTRIRYLRAHNFSVDMIQQIVNKHPPWLSFKTKEIDWRLGYFQHTFKLSGVQIKGVSTKCPKLITYDMKRIRRSTFAVTKQMGFNTFETRLILLNAPRVWIRAKTEVVKTFDYLHNDMKLSHDIISHNAKVLQCRKSRLERRHRFLVELKRNQYDPTKPLYVSPLNLVIGSDIDFCDKIAKSSLDIYNNFIKSL